MYSKIINELKASDTTLVAVSKTKPNEAILDIYHQGQRIFGENRVQEVVSKYEALPKDIEWHLIGQLQRNKVKYIAPFISMIHSVDSLRLLEEVNKQAAKQERVIDVLLQLKIAEEDTKAGFGQQEVEELLAAGKLNQLSSVRVVGLMGMATFTDDVQQVRAEFRRLKGWFDEWKQQYFAEAAYFKEISMGMSGDYQIAVEEGSTMVRIGSLIFGSRE